MGKIYKKVSAFTSVITGGTPSTKIKEYWDGGEINWLSSGDLNQGVIKYSSKKITDLGYQKSVTKIMPIGTVAIALTGATTGVCGILEIEACGNQSVTGILPSKNHDSKYLFYYLRSLREKIMNDSFGGAQQHINQQYVKDILVPIVSVDEQKQIAKRLAKAQELIDLRKESIAKLDELAKSIFIDMFGDPVINPKGWEVKNLNQVCINKGEYGSGASAIDYNPLLPRYLRITDINDNGSLKYEKKSPSIVENKYLLNKFDIVFARSGATVGKTYLHTTNEKLLYAGYLIKFMPNIQIINPSFLFYFTKTEYYKGWISSKQNVVAQPNINAKEYGSLNIIVPSIDLQNKFAQIIEKIEEQKLLYEQELAKLEENFQVLLQQSFVE